MNPSLIGLVVFVSLFGAALLGMCIRLTLPEHHINNETKEVVRLGMGSVATMAALLLGLLVASTKGAYDAEKDEVTKMSAKIIFLDRVLAGYGPETASSRVLLRRTVEHAISRIWPDQKVKNAELDPEASSASALSESIFSLSPHNEPQNVLKSQAVRLAIELGEMRWMLFEQARTSVSVPLLVIIISWLAILFTSFGLYAPRNSTAIVALMLAALSVSGAIFLIMEFNLPFGGVIQVSSEPLRNALDHLGH